MDQHICLFYLSDKLTVPKLQEFYQRMCSALGYSERKYDSYYLLYDTQYHVFQDTPLTDSRKKALRKIASCSSCHTICKKNMYKPYQIEDNACIVCKLSSLYRNGRIHSEANVLRRFLEPNVPFSDVFLNPSIAFASCIRLGRDYAIGTFPVIQLNAFLYSYLKDKNGYGALSKDEFLDGFVLFLLAKVTSSSSADAHMDVSEFRELVAFQMERLYGIDYRSITSDLWENEVSTLRTMYTYVAPSPSYKGTSVSLAPEHKKEEPFSPSGTIGKQFSLFDMILPTQGSPVAQKSNDSDRNMYEGSTYSEATNDGKSLSDKVFGKIDSEMQHEFSTDTEIVPNTEVDMSTDVCDSVFNPDDLPEIPEGAFEEYSDTDEMADYYPDEDIPDEAFSAYDGFVPEELLYDDSGDKTVDASSGAECHSCPDVAEAVSESLPELQESSDAPAQTNPLMLPAVMPSVLDACITVSDSLFEGAVQPLTSEKCFSFSEHVLLSSFVCVEPAVCFHRYGLLVFVQDNLRTYFFDLELYGADILESLFMEDTLMVYTMHTLAVTALFARSRSSFHKLCPLDLILSSKRNIYDYSPLFNELGWKKGAFYNYMPSYPSVYAEATDGAENGFIRSIRKTMILCQVLARNDNLSFLNERLDHNLIVDDLRSVRFKYRFGMEIHQKGLMYIFALPKDSISCVISEDSLFSDMLVILNLLPHLHRKKVYLLSVEQDRLIFFYLGDKENGSQFYDLFLARLQHAYIKRYNTPMQSNSYCYLFDKKL